MIEFCLNKREVSEKWGDLFFTNNGLAYIICPSLCLYLASCLLLKKFIFEGFLMIFNKINITIIRDSRFQNIHMFQITEKNFNNIKRFLRELDIYTEKKKFKINTDNPLTEKEIILLRDIIGKPSTIYDGMKLDFSKSFEENCRDWGKSEFLTFSNRNLYGTGMHGNVYCGVCAILSKKGYISNPSDKKRTISINKENFEKIKKHISEIVPEKVSVESKIEVENVDDPKEKPRGMWSKIKSFFGVGKEYLNL